MAEQSITSFVDEVLDRNYLSCALCGNILRLPIMLLENIGNVCSICYEEKDDISKLNSLRNVTLENLLKLMRLPCRYKVKGCTENLDYEDLVVHQTSCKYRTKLCSLFNFVACKWEGNTIDFINHFKESHGDHVINFENNIFFLETTLNELNLVKLLVMKHHTYVLRMQTNLKLKRLFYMICNIHDENSSFCEYSVKHKGSSDNYIKTKSKVLPSFNIYNDFDENIAVDVSLDALKEISHISDTITNIFKIKLDDSKMEVIDEKMLHFFECPVCSNFMKPPIFQCQSGHSICNVCRPKLEKCPTCRAIFGTTRNYSLEGLTIGVQYPCIYHDLGCTETSTANSIIRHEKECSFKPYNCPFSNCSSSGNHQSMVAHLVNIHADSVISSGASGYSDTFRLDLNSSYTKILDRKCVLVYNHIFRLTCTRIAEHCLFSAEVFGCYNDAKLFVYEVAIIDVRKPEKKLIRTDYCFGGDIPLEDLHKRCIMFPNSILSSYSNHGMFTFQFKIKEM